MGAITEETILGIDPGVRVSGWAVIKGLRTLSAGVLRVGRGYDYADSAEYQAQQLLKELQGLKIVPETIVVECPQVYPNQFTRVDPNDLVRLAYAAGAVSHKIAHREARLVAVLPRQWKGNLPKHVHQQRLETAHPTAGPTIRKIEPAGLRNHAWDAVGLAYWQLERTRSEIFQT